MRRTMTVAVSAALLVAACDGQSKPGAPASTASAHVPGASADRVAAGPDLGTCKPFKLAAGDSRLRDAPLPVPDTLKAVLASDLDHYAVLTLDGNTLCIETPWMTSVENLALADEGRFLSFDWVGYEEYGHQVVDRSGPGQVVDTGVAPQRSPSGRRFAAVEYSESGFGSLNAFAVWDIRKTGLTQVARIEELPPEHTDWRLDRWPRENCLELSAVAYADSDKVEGRIDRAPRRPFVAREADGRWDVQAADSCRTA